MPSATAIAFLFYKSLYVDNKTKLCDSRENLQLSLQRIFAVSSNSDFFAMLEEIALNLRLSSTWP